MKRLFQLETTSLRILPILLCLLFTFSCRHHNEPQPKSRADQQISIQEAKDWFEGISLSKLNTKDTTIKKGYSNTKPQWNVAEYKSFENGKSYVQIPLQYIQKTKRWKNDPQKKTGKAQNQKPNLLPDPQLIIFKNETGKIISQVMELEPDQEYYLNHQGFTTKKDYSGLLMLRNWEGELEGGSRYENGQVTGRITVPTLNSRVEYEVCEDYITYYFTAACNEWGVLVVRGTHVTVRSGEPANPGPVTYGEDYYCTGWELNGSNQFRICPDVGGGDTGGGNPDPTTGFIAFSELQVNNKALYGPCPGLTNNWRNLIDFKPSQLITNRLNQLTQNQLFMSQMDRPNFTLPDSWFVQAISDANGIAINLDNFSVFMDNLPTVNGRQLTINEFTEYVRLNLNTHVDTQLSSFDPHPLTGVDEGAKWRSSNPLGAVMSIGIPGDPGSVIVSEFYPGYESSGWTFSTIHDPLNGDHPVSGTRVFGCYETADGYIFYTQGADRLTGYGDALLGLVTKAASGQEFQFTKADNLWRSMQTKVAAFINSHGAHATIRTPIKNRPDWQKVKEAMENNRSLSTVPCN